jgi:iron complex transport system ATP-binding protein
MRLLHTHNLQIKVGTHVLISDLNWEVQRGQFWCVLGKNGSGKSSLLHVLAGLNPCEPNSLSYTGKNIQDIDAATLARHRSLMLQQHVDSFSHSVLDTVLIGRLPYRYGSEWDAEEDVKLAHSALQQCGLSHKVNADVSLLSGGERQRVALAAQLCQQADVMLLDEPISHQDVAHQLSVMQLLSGLKENCAVIATCHDLQLARRFATHALILGDGQHWQGIAQEVIVPEILEQAFNCQFSLQHGVLSAA